MSKVFVITHKDCFDGITAAWVLSKRYPNAEFFQQNYSDTPILLDLVKRDPDAYIIIADFSYPIEELIKAAWAQQGGAILLMDHHAPFIRQVEAYRLLEDANEVPPIPSHVEFILDNDRSGAMIAWEHCNSAVHHHWLVAAVQDNDLHRNEIDNTRDVVQAIGFYGMSIEAVDIVSQMTREELANLGKVLRQKQSLMIDWHIDNTTRYISTDIGAIPVTNAPRYVGSDVAGALATHTPFAISYYHVVDGIKLSFRSNQKTGLDVSKLAALFGGSGHRNAAGATIGPHVTVDWVVEKIVEHLEGKTNGQ